MTAHPDSAWRPTGDVDHLHSIAAQLQNVARAAQATAAVQGRSGGDLAHAWSGEAATLAARDLTTLAGRGREMLRGFDVAAGAIRRYAGELARVSADAARVRRDRDAALEEFRVGVARAELAHAAEPLLLAAALMRLGDERDHRLRTADRGLARLRDELELAGRNCAAALDGAQASAGSPQGPLAAPGQLKTWMLGGVPTVERVEHMRQLAAKAAAELENPEIRTNELLRAATLRRYAEQSNDPVFATMLLNRLGAKGALDLALLDSWTPADDSMETAGVVVGAGAGSPPSVRMIWAKLLQSGVSNATVGVNERWAADLLGELRSRPPADLFRFASLTRDFGPSRTEFVLPYAEMVYKSARESAFHQGGTTHAVLDAIDPMTSVMRALQRNTDAARSFFDPKGDLVATGRSERLDWLLTDRGWGDSSLTQHGVRETYNAVAAIIAGSERDPLSVTLASLVVKLIGEDDAATDANQKGVIRPEHRLPVAKIVAPYLWDLANISGASAAPLVTTIPGDSSTAPRLPVVSASSTHRDLVLGKAARSEEAYKLLFSRLRTLQSQLYLEELAKGRRAVDADLKMLWLMRTIGVEFDDETRASSTAKDAEHNAVVDAVTSELTSLVGGAAAKIPGSKGLTDAALRKAGDWLIGQGGKSLGDLMRRDSSQATGLQIAESRGADFKAIVTDAVSLEWSLSGRHPEASDWRFKSLFVDGDPRKPRLLSDIVATDRGTWAVFVNSEFGDPYKEIEREFDQSYDRRAL